MAGLELGGASNETILHRSDQAMYASKDRGRNRFSADIADSFDIGEDQDATTPVGTAPADPNPVPENE